MMHFTTRNHQSNTLSIILNNVIAGIRNIYIIWMLDDHLELNGISTPFAKTYRINIISWQIVLDTRHAFQDFSSDCQFLALVWTSLF